MATLTVQLTGVDKLQRKFQALASLKAVKSAITQGAYMVEADAKALAPSGTSSLRNSIHVSVDSTPKTVTGVVTAHSNHAIYVEFGTGSEGKASGHPKAKGFNYTDKKYWRYTPDNGETFKTAHPRRAKPFMYRALKQNKQRVIKLVEDAIMEAK